MQIIAHFRTGYQVIIDGQYFNIYEDGRCLQGGTVCAAFCAGRDRWIHIPAGLEDRWYKWDRPNTIP